MKRRWKIIIATIALFSTTLVAFVVWQHQVYQKVTDPKCQIDFGDYLQVRRLVFLNPIGEYVTDRFVLSIRPGWPTGLNVKTGRKGDDRTGEGGIYVLQKEKGNWLISGTGFWAAPGGSRPRREPKVSPQEWPKTLEEATSQLIEKMTDTDKETVRETPREDLIVFHMGWGMAIRNGFGLWQGNDALLESCGVQHPDDASGVIIESVWRRLNDQRNSEPVGGANSGSAAASPE
jgi:hypothetical protein